MTGWLADAEGLLLKLFFTLPFFDEGLDIMNVSEGLMGGVETPRAENYRMFIYSYVYRVFEILAPRVICFS